MSQKASAPAKYEVLTIIKNGKEQIHEQEEIQSQLMELKEELIKV